MFSLKTRTSWQKSPTDIQLRNLNQSFQKYPLVERRFFDDLVENCQKHEHYFVEMGLLRILNEQKKELNGDFWILLWALDKEDRYYQLLIERNPEYSGRGAIAAAGPPEFFEFMSGLKDKMILPLLGMINTPEKMKQVGLIVSRPATYQQQAKERTQMHALGRFKNWVDQLKATPNKEGQWFPGNFPRCPVPGCEGPLVGIQDANNPAYGHLICPMCGYTEKKLIRPDKNQPDWRV